jgi:hypothetical protein
MECIAFDSHKHYTWALVEDGQGRCCVTFLEGHEPAGIVPAEP